MSTWTAGKVRVLAGESKAEQAALCQAAPHAGSRSKSPPIVLGCRFQSCFPEELYSLSFPRLSGHSGVYEAVVLWS